MGARAVLFGPAAAWLLLSALGLWWTLGDDAAWGAVDRRGSTVVGSADCRRCHPGQWESWHASYHRTMTQEATGEVVLAPFAGETLRYGGFVATMTRTADDRPHLRVEREGAGEVVLDVDVLLTVGSHRYQQYVAAIDRGGGPGERFRLPVAWHRAEGRWIHLNGAFVEPEGEPGDLEAWLRHLSRWNDNCLFCHNTEPAPGLDAHGRFESRVGELGIACEACHGPAGEHTARHANPLRRLLARGGDASVAHPGRLGPARESGLCGRCHGQRIGHDMARILRDGDGFLPGTDLAAVSRPIFRDSKLRGEASFSDRFWPDETPRLSAYEYQGLLLSPCWDEGRGLACNHCHDMHGQEPDMQVRAGRAGSGACVGCHAPATLGGAEQPGGHGGHGEVAPALDCLGCHMPRITYGLLEGMITHRIASPDPGALVGRADQPDACTQCHVDRSRSWAAASMPALGLRGTPAGPASTVEGLGSRVALDLVGGDPLQRNLAADALGQVEATGDVRTKMAWLAATLDDEYPSVRWFARRSLRSLARRAGDREIEELAESFDYLGPPEVRVPIVAKLRERLGPGAFEHHPDVLVALEEAREDRAIWIGE